jgi:hypothetical protein
MRVSLSYALQPLLELQHTQSLFGLQKTLLGNGLQLWTFPFLLVPELSPTSVACISLLTNCNSKLLRVLYLMKKRGHRAVP